MNTIEMFEKLSSRVRLQTAPLSIKILSGDDRLPANAIRPAKYGIQISLCQWTTFARTWRRPAGVLTEDINCSPCLAALGLKKLDSEKGLVGYFMEMGYFEDKKKATHALSQLKILPPGGIRGVLMTPMEKKSDFQPDLYWIYGTPAQMSRLVAGLVYKTGQLVESLTTGFGIACLSMVKPFITKKATLVNPGRGERILAGTEDCEMALSLPAELMEALIQGLENTHEKGTRYPVQKYVLYEPPILKQMKNLDRRLAPIDG